MGLLLGYGLPLLINTASWADYFSAMQTHSELYRNDIDPRPGPQSYPPTIEGIPTDILGAFVPIAYADSSLFTLLRAMGCDNFRPDPLLFVVLAPFAVWLWLTRRQSAERLLAGIAAWYFLADFALPSYRNNYNDVLILDVVLLGFIVATRIPWAAWPCALALPMGWAVYAFSPEQAGLINLPTAFFTLGAILAAVHSTFLFNNRAGSRKVEAAC